MKKSEGEMSKVPKKTSEGKMSKVPKQTSEGKMSKVPSHYVEGVVSVSHGDGVFRIMFGQRAPEEDRREEVCLFLPASQLGNVLQTLATAAREIGAKIKEDAENKEDAVN